jgi:hypothetical protein
VQPAGGDPPIDDAEMQAEGEQLRPMNHGVLPLRDHDLPLDGLTATIAVNPTRAAHTPSVPSENVCVARAL